MTPKVPDYGHREADKTLWTLIKRLHLSYRQASISLRGKLEDYLDQFDKEDAMKRALYDSGELSHEDYMKWRYSTLAGTKQWKRMLKQLTDDMVNQDKIAASMIDDTLPGVYALNHNYGTYEAEVGSGYDTTYTMYDKFTVKRLVEDGQVLLPEPSVNVPKDEQWNKQHIQSAVLQGILTGEPMKDIAKRFENVVGMDERSAIRNARTAVTGAENAGRVDSYLRAEKMGIQMKQVWMATLDDRTRDSHAILDGQKVDPGKKFSNGCRYPGDPAGAIGEIANCRCTLVAEVEGSDPFEGKPNVDYSQISYGFIAMGGQLGDDYAKLKNIIDKDPVSNNYSNYSEYWKDLKAGNIKNQEIDTILAKHGFGTFTMNRPSELLKNMTYDEWKKSHIKQPKVIEPKSISDSFKNVLRHADYIPCKDLEKIEPEYIRIEKIGGGDLTSGSCASLALTYAGRTNGIDVRDFRDGYSRTWFADKQNKRDMAVECGIVHQQIFDPDKTGWEKLKSANIEDGVEYLLGYAKHMAVIRKKEKEFEFLELQTTFTNGWHKLTSKGLKYRFGNNDSGRYDTLDIYDVRTCKGEKFKEFLGYLNTEVGQEKKGKGGSAK